MVNETTDCDDNTNCDKITTTTTAPPATVKPRIDCGESPLERKDTGCPCFDIDTITGQMDLTNTDYCNLYASKPVNESDPCSHLYPRYAYFYADAPYTETENFYVSFEVSGHSYDPDMEGGYCSGSVYDDQTGRYSGESHSYYIGDELDKTGLEACEKVFDELKVKLEDITNCFVEIGGDPYYY
jgi:hypothetical protein